MLGITARGTAASMLTGVFLTFVALLAPSPRPAWGQDGRCERPSLFKGQGGVRFINAGPGVDVQSTSDGSAGSGRQARFGYYDVAARRVHLDDGAFTLAPNTTQSFAWHRVPPMRAAVRFVDVDNWRYRLCASIDTSPAPVAPGPDGIPTTASTELGWGGHPSRPRINSPNLRKYPQGCIGNELIDAWDLGPPSNPPAGVTDPDLP